MYAVVTGVAGFIGSHLAEQLVRSGNRVLGIDCFTEYYDVGTKWFNLTEIRDSGDFELVAEGLRDAPLEELFQGVDVVFHLAAQPGVRTSWASGFADYCDHNVMATQRVLEAARVVRRPRVVYASSSSVYGNAPAYPTDEEDLPRPASPYGVTKLAGEHLCRLYAVEHEMTTIALRYFTVFGPRQRPDMAIRRLIESTLSGDEFPLYGTGRQIRDFTYVGDVVRASLLAATADAPPGTVANIAGGTSASLADVVLEVERLTGTSVRIDKRPRQPGDVEHTGGRTEVASRVLGWEPEVGLEEGLKEEIAWCVAHRQQGPAL